MKAVEEPAIHELNLRFPADHHVHVTFEDVDSGALPFVSPLTAKDLRDLQWYLEVYGAYSLGDPDDSEALENPRISIRRRVAGVTGGRRPFRVEAKDRLHLLFVVSRPEGAGFLDPRAKVSSISLSVSFLAVGFLIWLIADLELAQPGTTACLAPVVWASWPGKTGAWGLTSRLP